MSQTNIVDNTTCDSKDTSTIRAVNILLGASFDDKFINASILGAALNNIALTGHFQN